MKSLLAAVVAASLSLSLPCSAEELSKLETLAGDDLAQFVHSFTEVGKALGSNAGVRVIKVYGDGECYRPHLRETCPQSTLIVVAAERGEYPTRSAFRLSKDAVNWFDFQPLKMEPDFPLRFSVSACVIAGTGDKQRMLTNKFLVEVSLHQASATVVEQGAPCEQH